MNKLETLFDFLDSDDNEYGLDKITTHGFLCATIVGPTLKNWCDVLFDGHQHTLPKHIIDDLYQWREQIITDLKADETIELPIEESMLEVESELGDWSIGFVDAMYANQSNDWFETALKHDVDEEEIATLTLPMNVFSGIEEDDEDLQVMRKDETLLASMASSMSQNLSELYLIFHMPT